MATAKEYFGYGVKIKNIEVIDSLKFIGASLGNLYYTNASGVLTALAISTDTTKVLGISGGIPAWVTLPASGEVPLTFSNGLTRTSNNIKLGGTLINNTIINTANFGFKVDGVGGTIEKRVVAGYYDAIELTSKDVSNSFQGDAILYMNPEEGIYLGQPGWALKITNDYIGLAANTIGFEFFNVSISLNNFITDFNNGRDFVISRNDSGTPAVNTKMFFERDKLSLNSTDGVDTSIISVKKNEISFSSPLGAYKYLALQNSSSAETGVVVWNNSTKQIKYKTTSQLSNDLGVNTIHDNGDFSYNESSKYHPTYKVVQTSSAVFTDHDRDGVGLASCNGRLFTLGGWYNSVQTGEEIYDLIRYSEDNGVTWATWPYTLPYSSHNFVFFKAADGWHYIIGSDYYRPEQYQTVHRTRDFKTFVKMTDTAGWGNRTYCGGTDLGDGRIAFFGGQTEVSNTYPSPGVSDVWVSSDGGATWTKEADNINVDGNYFLANNITNQVKRIGDRVFCVGQGNFSWAGYLYSRKVYSASVYNLQDWKYEGEYPNFGSVWSGVEVWDGKIWVAPGYNASQGGNTYGLWYMDKDGTWHVITHADSGVNTLTPTHSSHLVVHGDSLYRVAGNATNTAFRIYRSNEIFSIGDYYLHSKLKIDVVNNAVTNPDKFLVIDNNEVKYLTSSQMASYTTPTLDQVLTKGNVSAVQAQFTTFVDEIHEGIIVGSYTTSYTNGGSIGFAGSQTVIARLTGRYTGALEQGRLIFSTWLDDSNNPAIGDVHDVMSINGFGQLKLYKNPVVSTTPYSIVTYNTANNMVERISLAGTGTRMVVADSDGVLSTQAISTGGGGSGVTSVAASVTASTALTVSGSPITSTGTLAFSWTGNNTQIVLGDGTLMSPVSLPRDHQQAALSSDFSIATDNVLYSVLQITITAGWWDFRTVFNITTGVSQSTVFYRIYDSTNDYIIASGSNLPSTGYIYGSSMGCGNFYNCPTTATIKLQITAADATPMTVKAFNYKGYDNATTLTAHRLV